MDDTHARGFNMSKKEVTAEIVKECHERGAAVAIYTVNDEPAMKELIGIGVNALFTDRPDLMLKLIQGM
jgi:glycerophosphoryl diester phosphodiesterase